MSGNKLSYTIEPNKIICFEGLTLSSHSSVASVSLSKTDTGIVITGFSPRIRSPVLEFSIQVENLLVEIEHLDTVSSWPPFRSPCQRSPGSSDGFNIVKIAIRQNMPLKRNQIEIHSRRGDEDDIDRRRWWRKTPWQDKQAQWASIEELCWKGNNLLLHWRLTPPDQEKHIV